jgi:probable HAF family extracellular repeat protein
MKLRTFTCIAAMTLFAALATTVRLAAQEQQQQQSASPKHYRLTVLGTLGGTVSVAQGGVNNRGQLAGFSSLPGDTAFYAFLWQHGVMTDLGSLPGSSISSTFANPNEKGEVSGFLNTAVLDPNGQDFCFDGTHLICLGFLWRDGVMTAMPTLGGNNSFAYMLNNRNLTNMNRTCPLRPRPSPVCLGPRSFGVGREKPQLLGNTAALNDRLMRCHSRGRRVEGKCEGSSQSAKIPHRATLPEESPTAGILTL